MCKSQTKLANLAKVSAHHTAAIISLTQTDHMASLKRARMSTSLITERRMKLILIKINTNSQTPEIFLKRGSFQNNTRQPLSQDLLVSRGAARLWDLTTSGCWPAVNKMLGGW